MFKLYIEISIKVLSFILCNRNSRIESIGKFRHIKEYLFGRGILSLEDRVFSKRGG